MKSWIKISYTWLFCGGRKFTEMSFRQCSTIDELRKEHDRINSHVGQHPNHWAYRDFGRMYHKRQMELFYGW